VGRPLRYVGIYRHGLARLDVSLRNPATLVAALRATPVDGSHRSSWEFSSVLTPCSLDAFMLSGRASAFGPWPQFLRPSANAHDFEWNGRQVLRRD